MYWNVPTIVPSAVSGPRRRRQPVAGATAGGGEPNFARPKSSSFAPVSRQHHVARLEVAMDDAGAMRAVERVGDLDGDAAAPDRAAAGRSSRRSRERLAFEMLHHQEVDAVLVVPTS